MGGGLSGTNLVSARPAWRSMSAGAGLMACLCLYLTLIAVAGLSSRPRPADLGVVFGNTVTADGRPSPRLKARLDTALSLYRRNMVRRILVSGGIEQPGGLDEAAVMANYLARAGVPRSVLIQDAAGVNSFATARHAAALVTRDDGVVVVTQWFHVPRAIVAMHRFGLRNVSGAWPAWFEARDIYSLVREAVALPFYAVRSGAAASPPTGSPQRRS